jgi:hypothetical protein
MFCTLPVDLLSEDLEDDSLVLEDEDFFFFFSATSPSSAGSGVAEPVVHEMKAKRSQHRHSMLQGRSTPGY